MLCLCMTLELQKTFLDCCKLMESMSICSPGQRNYLQWVNLEQLQSSLWTCSLFACTFIFNTCLLSPCLSLPPYPSSPLPPLPLPPLPLPFSLSLLQNVTQGAILQLSDEDKLTLLKHEMKFSLELARDCTGVVFNLFACEVWLIAQSLGIPCVAASSFVVSR